MSSASTPKNADYPVQDSEGSLVFTADIKIGKRHRRDMGDIDALAQNIADIGLLQPVVITPDRRLIAGFRRLDAYRKLGLASIAARIIDLDQVVRGEYAENYFRKQFTPSEMADIADELEQIERQAAKERQGERTDKHPGKFPGSSGRALDHIARIVGKDRKTIAKAREVRDAARAEPERYGKLLADMDRTGRVSGPHRRLSNIKAGVSIRAEPPPYPGNGPYRVASVDFPWEYDKNSADPTRRGVLPYPSMTMAQIVAEVPKLLAIMHQDCVLWVWATNAHMRDAYTVVHALGFVDKTVLTWGKVLRPKEMPTDLRSGFDVVKSDIRQGDWLRGQTEHAIMAVRGKPVVTITNQSTLLLAPSPRDASGKVIHSAKPDEFYSLVESLCPAPRYAELFARRTRERWDAHGDEVQRRSADEGGEA